MAAKTANVVARVEPEIKEKAEAILESLGMPVSVVINMLYRQIIQQRGIPFSLNLPLSIPTLDTMSREEFDAMMTKGWEQSEAGQGCDLDEAFDRILSVVNRG